MACEDGITEGLGISLKVSHIIVAVASVALTALGFAVGVVVSDNGIPERASRTESLFTEVSDVSAVPVLPARTPSIPGSDVEGSEVDGLPRYPGSVRTEYIREDQGGIIWTETEYMTTASLEDVRLFYRDVFREDDWSVNDVSFSQEAWIFFIVSGEREVFVNLRPRGDFVEVDIEHTEPDEPAPGTTGETSTAKEETPQQPEQQPLPVVQEPVYRESAPVYGGDDDAYEDHDDDGYEGDD